MIQSGTLGKNNKIRIYPTLKCNLACRYCVNSIGEHYQYKEMPAKKWLSFLNHINLPVVITGGEPTLYKGIYELINGLYPNVAVYTNGQFDVSEFMKNVHRRLDIALTDHTGEEDFNNKAELLRKRHNVSAGRITSQKNQWNIFSQNYQEFKEVRSVTCQRDNILIGPNGKRYPCVSKLLRNKDPLEDLNEVFLQGKVTKVRCNEYGKCSPCDFLGGVRINANIS